MRVDLPPALAGTYLRLQLELASGTTLITSRSDCCFCRMPDLARLGDALHHREQALSWLSRPDLGPWSLVACCRALRIPLRSIRKIVQQILADSAAAERRPRLARSPWRSSTHYQKRAQ